MGDDRRGQRAVAPMGIGMDVVIGPLPASHTAGVVPRGAPTVNRQAILGGEPFGGESDSRVRAEMSLLMGRRFRANYPRPLFGYA